LHEAYVARELGARLALEMTRPGPGGNLGRTVPEAAALIADIGSRTSTDLRCPDPFRREPSLPLAALRPCAAFVGCGREQKSP
jgi:hypothetical protein